jgi:hypothetical protein
MHSVASCGRWWIQGPPDSEYRRCITEINSDRDGGPEEAEANARLIAAAPDYKHATCLLRDFVQALAGQVVIPPGFYLQGKTAMDAARDAIKKERGE